MRTCNMCDDPATVIDTEYDEAYCERHADEYKVLDGPHRFIPEGEG